MTHKLESELFTGPGWRPPTELSGSTESRIGGGRQAIGGGVPVRSNYRGDDTTALTHAVWKQFLPSGGNSHRPPSSSSTHLDSHTFGDPTLYNFNTSTFICRALSECEPCPPAKRNHPFCRPYGNRRSVACRNMLDSGGIQDNLPKPFQTVVKPSADAPPTEIEFQGWEACGKVVSKETKDYLEFVMILILAALAALMLLIKRNRYLTQRKADADLASSSNSTNRGTAQTRTRRARLPRSTSATSAH